MWSLLLRSFLLKGPLEFVAEGIGHLLHVGHFAVIHGETGAHALAGNTNAAAKLGRGYVFVHEVVKNGAQTVALLRSGRKGQSWPQFPALRCLCGRFYCRIFFIIFHHFSFSNLRIQHVSFSFALSVKRCCCQIQLDKVTTTREKSKNNLLPRDAKENAHNEVGM